MPKRFGKNKTQEINCAQSRKTSKKNSTNVEGVDEVVESNELPPVVENQEPSSEKAPKSLGVEMSFAPCDELANQKDESVQPNLASVMPEQEISEVVETTEVVEKSDADADADDVAVAESNEDGDAEVVSKKIKIKAMNKNYEKLKTLTIKEYLKRLDFMFDLNGDEKPGDIITCICPTERATIKKKWFGDKLWQALFNPYDVLHGDAIEVLLDKHWGDKSFLWTKISGHLLKNNEGGKFNAGCKFEIEISNLNIYGGISQNFSKMKKVGVKFNPVLKLSFVNLN